MLEDEIDRLLPPSMAIYIKWVLRAHSNVHIESLTDLLEFAEHNPHLLQFPDVRIRYRRGWIDVTWGQMHVTFYGGRRYNVCGFHFGTPLHVADFTIRQDLEDSGIRN